MARPGETYIVYSMVGAAVQLDIFEGRRVVLGTSHRRVRWPGAGTRQTVPGGQIVTLEPPATGAGKPWVAWLSRTND